MFFFISMVIFSSLIKDWYRLNYRDLPWRSTNDPYKIWLSEIILQQTRVDQGLNYYLKFVSKYPSVNDLADADQDEVLNLWQGLGYYSRARNLHAAAKHIKENYRGVFPSTYEDIHDLKGVGDYTASAIASFAFNLPHAVVDGNVYRLLSRYFNIDHPIDSAVGKKEFKLLAQELLDDKDPAQHNQAIMEMGALVCTPKNPACDNCPLNESCEAKRLGTVLNLPVKSKKTKVRNRYFHYLILIEDGQIVLKKRESGDIWEGLYDFPLIELNKAEESPELMAAQMNISELERHGSFKHILSHQRIYAEFWSGKSANFNSLKGTYKIVKLNDLEDFPMPQLLIRYLETSPFFNAD